MAAQSSTKVEVSLERVYKGGARYNQVHVLADTKKADDYITASQKAAAGAGVTLENIRKRSA